MNIKISRFKSLLVQYTVTIMFSLGISFVMDLFELESRNVDLYVYVLRYGIPSILIIAILKLFYDDANGKTYILFSDYGVADNIHKSSLNFMPWRDIKNVYIIHAGIVSGIEIVLNDGRRFRHDGFSINSGTINGLKKHDKVIKCGPLDRPRF